MNSEFLWQQLAQVLQRFPAAPRYWVAFSGGLDSHVLLHALVILRDTRRVLPEVLAVHINHGLHPDADEWERHCAKVCQALSVTFKAIRVRARSQAGESPEAAAREARYQALAPLVADDDLLLTAHHRDDQAETLLLQLVRGAGPSGLAAMPAYMRFGRGGLGRPLLEVSRAVLERYGYGHGLHWISDSSNADMRYDRNFIRHRVLPALQARWPSVNRTLSRVASNQQDAVVLLDDLAASDYTAVAGLVPRTLSRRRLVALTPERQRNVVRYWLRCRSLPTPGQVHLEAILLDAAFGSEQISPCMQWRGAQVRRYHDNIYAMRPLASMPRLRTRLGWDPRTPLELAQGRLRATRIRGAGLSARLCEEGCVEVRFRRGGERCRPAGRRHTRLLKKLFQEQGIPPWERGILPLICIDGDLAAVADLWVCEPFAARGGEDGWLVSWQPTESQARKPGNKTSPDAR